MPFLVRFQGAVGGLSQGAPVTLRGFRVGKVTAVHLDYDSASGELRTPVTVEIEPDRLLPQGDPRGRDSVQATTEAVGRLVQAGLRARLDRHPPVIGGQSVTLTVADNEPPAELITGGPIAEIPAAPSSDIGDIAAQVQTVMAKIDGIPVERIGRDFEGVISRIEGLVSSPQMKDSLDHLNSALANLDRVARTANRQVAPLVDSLHRTVEAAERAAGSLDAIMGGAGAEQDRNVAEALQELAGAARSVRSLANYLDRHPEALVQGRSRASR